VRAVRWAVLGAVLIALPWLVAAAFPGQQRYIVHVLVYTALFATLALSYDLVVGHVGALSLAHPALSRELGIAHMETRVGLSRAESMKNMAARTGSAALQSLTSMLVQADRFGTSIANALRIHSETLRLNRQHAAEEQAAKASVKMSFPLVLFIFPATFIVLAGPTVIQLLKSEIMR